jgi:NAD(P)-dependent dehydrogenase (short-subunit alcohol dehydrogenase family)
MENYILITGSSSGIGKEIAVSLSKENNIILHGRDKGRLESVKSLCSGNNKVLVWEHDFKDAAGIEASLKSFIKSNDISVSGFVHSAGFMKLLPLKSMNLEAINETINTNLVSAMLITRVLSGKLTNGNALSSIVFISSNISNFGAKAFSIYGASKSALDGFMRSIAVELAPAVRVNSVLPGSVRTAMTESIYENPDLMERMKLQYPLGLGETSDIASAVRFLLSGEARWITGQQITVDGGRTINITG